MIMIVLIKISCECTREFTILHKICKLCAQLEEARGIRRFPQEDKSGDRAMAKWALSSNPFCPGYSLGLPSYEAKTYRPSCAWILCN